MLYNDSELAAIKAQVDACAAHDIEFMFALSPGLDMCHSSEAEHNTLKAKLDQIADLGVRNFAILFDDISEELGSQDAQAFTSQVRQHRGLAGRWKLSYNPIAYPPSPRMPCPRLKHSAALPMPCSCTFGTAL